jgi:hypothetical protein
MKVTIALLLVGASIASVQAQVGLRQAAGACPTAANMISWAPCATKGSIQAMFACVGCSNLTPYKSCTQSMGAIVGESPCEQVAPALGKTGCSTPLNVLIQQNCK